MTSKVNPNDQLDQHDGDNRAKYSKKGPVVAIDGPAGTGKSSVTKRLADLLGFVHVDTGALYRAIAWKLLDLGAWGDGSTEVERERARELAKNIQLEFRRMPRRNPKNRLFADGKDVTNLIRTPEVSMTSSAVSAIPEVRSALHSLQRRLGCEGSTILEGRDIGTVIFPDADVKFFMTASVQERAKRRLAELEALGEDAPSFEEVKRQISQRDLQDSSRLVAPLKRAEDAIEIDTTLLTLDEVVEKMESIVRKKVGLEKK